CAHELAEVRGLLRTEVLAPLGSQTNCTNKCLRFLCYLLFTIPRKNRMDESLAPWYSAGDPEGEKVFRRNMLYLASIHSKFGWRLTGPTRCLAGPGKMLYVRFVLISFLAVLATDARAARHPDSTFHPEF